MPHLYQEIAKRVGDWRVEGYPSESHPAIGEILDYAIEQLLQLLAVDPDEIEDIYFTGALTDPSKTDFFVQYKDDKGKWRRYSPDFVLRKKSEAGGKVLIVEIKRESERGHPVEGATGSKAMEVRKWVDLNPEQLKYEMVFTPGPVVTPDQMRPVREFVAEEPA